MKTLQNRVKELLAEKRIDLFIGYEKGSGSRVRALFARTPEQVDKLVFDDTCAQNLANYLLKEEIKRFGKLGILANVPALRSILQLASEFQIKDGEVLVLFPCADGTLLEMSFLKN